MDWQQLLEELVQFIEGAAPAVWEVAQKQVVVETVQYIVGFVFVVGFCVAGYFVVRWLKEAAKKADYRDEEGYRLAAWFIGAVDLIGGCLLLQGLIGEIAGRLINPNYYAIQQLIEFVGGR